MKFLLIILFGCFFLFGCEHLKKHFSSAGDNKKESKLMLTTDTASIVTMRDTMVIYESVCRGCAYENSTNFSISDTAGIVELNGIITTDNSPSNMDGGSINKDLIIVPKKLGTTTFTLFKSYKEKLTAEDSANAPRYTIEVKN